MNRAADEVAQHLLQVFVWVKRWKPTHPGLQEHQAGMRGAAAQAGGLFDLADSQWYLNRELTWLEFNDSVNRLAHSLHSLGLRKSDRIAILAAPSIDAICSSAQARTYRANGPKCR